MPDDLALITSIANQLLEASAPTAARASEQVLERLVEYFDSDYAFLRRSDHNIRASLLAAEWPPRSQAGARDPFAVVSFSSDHRALAVCDNGKDVVTEHRHVLNGRGDGPFSVAAAPLVAGSLTTGVLGFVRCGGRKWKAEARDTLKTVASLFAQFQARVDAEEQLRHLAEHDDLTGLLNRRALLAYLTDRLASRQPGPVAVLYIDLDRLKAVNDSLGHAAGDRFLCGFADRLSAHAAGQGTVARLGGDEFVMIPHRPMAPREAELFAERIRKAVHDRLPIIDRTVTRTVSIGVAAGMPGHVGAAELLRRADEAVLVSKRAGGNRVTVAGDVSLKRRIRNDIREQLRGDADNGALMLRYLPEVDLWTGAVVAAEALVRWRHPARGALAPDAFLGVAGSMDLAADVDRWVLRTACAEFSSWRARDLTHRATLRINISPLQVTNPSFVPMVADTIAEFDMADGSLCLALTERSVVSNIGRTTRTFARLAELGVQTSITDFGTGYALLSHLQTLPIDALEIDPRFIAGLGQNVDDLAVVRAIIGLAEAFDLELIAKGVENPSTARALLHHGCHRVQGNLFSRPLVGAAMAQLLSARRVPMPFFTDDEALTRAVI